MDFTIKSDELGRELSLLEKIVARKPTIAVLANVLIVAEGESLTLCATDLELSLRTRCAASITKTGTVTMPAKKLTELVKSMPGAELRLRLNDAGALKMTGGTFDSRFQTMSAEDFPKMPDMPAESVALPREAFKRAVKQVRCAMTEGDQRFQLNGAQMTIDGKQLCLVATDGHRLARSLAATTAAGSEPVIIPGKAIAELSVLLNEEGEADVLYAKSEHQLFFNVDGRAMSAQLIEAKFPEWKRLIPKSANEIKVDRSMFMSSLRRVLMMSTERVKGVNLTIDKSGLAIDTTSHEYGDASEKVVAKFTGKAVLKTRCNGQYIVDFLDASTNEIVTLDFKDETSQIMFTDGGDYTYIVMPIRG